MGTMKNFALIGASGFIAPRHMKAIKETGNRLLAALDHNDSVGVIDSYFPEADFFTEFERFDRHAEKLRRKGDGHRIDYVSIASPNYLHDAHIRFALRVGADAICEKPLVLNPWNLDALQEIEEENGRRVRTILQLRLHPAVIALKKRVEEKKSKGKCNIDLTYITARGHWYHSSWKGDESKSGGIATNIGIHFFDVLLWIFGPLQYQVVHIRQADKAAGFLELERARVRWLLSIDADDLPAAVREAKKTCHRSLLIDGEEFDMSEGFTDLHTVSYRDILEGRGPGLDEARPAIQAAYNIRHAVPQGLTGEYHPWMKHMQEISETE
jgi:UDP-N-acetyl-2-amino-2-deoxyglucuronate dehydrogenase